jgi:hypothetical protein
MAVSGHIQDDLVAAMRSRDAARLSALRMIKAALKNREVEKRAPLSDDEERAVLETLVKQRREASLQFRQGGRDELAVKEEFEMELISGYLPASATEMEMKAAIDHAVNETGAASVREMGRVMKATLGLLAGKTVDGARVSALVREKLQAG